MSSVLGSGAPVSGGVVRPTGPVQFRAEVLAVHREGAYTSLTMSAPLVPDRFRPGHFASVAVGGADTSMLLRRAFSIYRAGKEGAHGGTMQLVVGPKGRGTRWLVDRKRGDTLDVIAPLGRPFMLPRDPVSCVLVGGGYGSAPLFGLAEQLTARGCRVDFVLGAASRDRLFGTLEARRVGNALTVTTDDGSEGTRGRVTEVLEHVIRRSDADVVYACGPMPMLRAVSQVAAATGAHAQTAVEEAMACGIGICMTCVLPVVGNDGITRMTRSCMAGPVFDGSRVRWDDVGTVPADCLGSPQSNAAVEAERRSSPLPRVDDALGRRPRP